LDLKKQYDGFIKQMKGEYDRGRKEMEEGLGELKTELHN
jgi:hypothetical protein